MKVEYMVDTEDHEGIVVSFEFDGTTADGSEVTREEAFKVADEIMHGDWDGMTRLVGAMNQ